MELKDNPNCSNEGNEHSCESQSDYTGPQTFFSLGVVSEESAFRFPYFWYELLGHRTSVVSLKFGT
jgi:hypothetical protein